MDIKELITLATEWAGEHEGLIASSGRILTPAEIHDAEKVGIIEPSRVRVLSSGCIPLPTHPSLASAMRQVGITGGIAGMALGHGIYLDSRYGTRRTLAHELTHVRQAELAGGMRQFFEAYIPQCLEHGYENAPFEVEARAVAARICS